jgi:hypothetical protein
VSVQALVEGEEASEVAALRLDGGGRLAGDLAAEVQNRERGEAAFGVGKARRDVMLRILCQNEGGLGGVSGVHDGVIYTITAVIV